MEEDTAQDFVPAKDTDSCDLPVDESKIAELRKLSDELQRTHPSTPEEIESAIRSLLT